MSVPSATSQSPAATATAEPLDEPHGARCTVASQGFHGAPTERFVPQPPKASSTVWVLPTAA